MDIEVLELGDGVVMRPDDELDLLGYQAFGEKVDEALHEGVKYIVIDFSLVTYVNSSAVRVLLALFERAGSSGASIALSSARAGALACLEACGALAKIKVHETAEEAMSSVGGL